MININKANGVDLQEIIHIGPKRAMLIIKHRDQKKFRDLYEMSTVSGLGTNRMRDIITQGIAEA